MIKKTLTILILISGFFQAKSQNYELNLGLRIQKTQKLYWENGIAADFTSDFLLTKKVHIKASITSSRLGSAYHSNAIRQENYLVGADWRFRKENDLQIFTGLNTGFFHADMEEEMFEILPHNSLLFSLEAGLSYKFKFPLAVNLSAGYNIINGDGVNSPGTLFPVNYQFSLFYKIK